MQTSIGCLTKHFLPLTILMTVGELLALYLDYKKDNEFNDGVICAEGENIDWYFAAEKLFNTKLEFTYSLKE